MLVGIVNLYKEPHGSLYIFKAILALGHTPLLLQYKEPELYTKIQNSNITRWIFSGSNHTVIHRFSPQILLKKLLVPQNDAKRFFFICYSMESGLLQLGHRVVRRATGLKRETIPLLLCGKIIRVWRNHRYYTPSLPNHSQAHEVASYNGESMMVIYKSITMTQFHPERTPDGYKILEDWLR